MSRVWAVLAWLATGLAAFTHVQAFGGAPLSPWGLGTLLLAFGLTAGALLALVLRVQQELSVGHPLRGALGDRLPRWGRWLLGLGFVYLGLQLLDVMPGGGGRGAGFSFDRTFSAILAWQALAAALFHQGGWIRSQGSRQGPEA